MASRQTATGTATVSWAPPTARTDGTPLTDLAGYKVHYGTTLGSYPNVIVINNAGVTTYVVENLAEVCPQGAIELTCETSSFVETTVDRVTSLVDVT